MYQEAGVFALTRKDLSGQEMAKLFVTALPGMRKRAMTIVPPFVFSILRGGDFSQFD